ncbi:MAG: 3-deoxy-manno-octulosonate cytidylyltransferase [Flavobacteriaceae bacterium]
MKVIAVIPARFEASRFPGKLMQPLGGAPVIVQTYRTVVATQLFEQVIVATDDETIAKVIIAEGGEVFLSQKAHQCGSDRIAEAIAKSDADIVVNVQGDEPFIHTQSLSDLLAVFNSDDTASIALASLMFPLQKEAEINNPNNVKVIVDQNNFALYFSRSPIPFYRENRASKVYFKHIGIYAFRRQALLAFSQSKMTPLEKAEKIECIRYLEQGKKIKMVVTPYESIGIDIPEDLEKAYQYLKQQ